MILFFVLLHFPQLWNLYHISTSQLCLSEKLKFTHNFFQVVVQTFQHFSNGKFHAKLPFKDITVWNQNQLKFVSPNRILWRMHTTLWYWIGNEVMNWQTFRPFQISIRKLDVKWRIQILTEWVSDKSKEMYPSNNRGESLNDTVTHVETIQMIYRIIIMLITKCTRTWSHNCIRLLRLGRRTISWIKIFVSTKELRFQCTS